MSKNTNFQDLLNKSSYELQEQRKSAINWIRDLILKLKTATTRNPQAKSFQKVGFPELGRMYLYSYDPKYKHILPYYDAFPLVIPIEYYANGFLGINLHYLPETMRIALLQELSKITNNNKFDKTTKINVTYRMLKQMSTRFDGIDGCIKRYLYSHVKSKFQLVAPSEWSKVAVLPLQRWIYNSSKRKR
jgi:hypothetical protein